VLDAKRIHPRRLLTNDGYLFIVIALLALLILALSSNRWFDHDEFEHVHSAWYIQNGYLPYSDFYQVHNPLLWYLMLPILSVFGDSIGALVALRALMYVLTLGLALATYLVARKATASRQAALLSVVILLSMVMFVWKSIEIRPDVPQVLFGLISIYWLLSFMKTGEPRHAALSGFAAGVSFLFLQKTVFLLIAYGPLFGYLILRRRMSPKSFLHFTVPFVVLLLLLLSYLLISGSVQDYVVSNWLLHPQALMPPFAATRFTASHLTENALFWLLLLPSFGFAVLSTKTSLELRTTVYVGLALLASPLAVRRPYGQYFLFAIPLCCIAVSYTVQYLCTRLRLWGASLVIMTVVMLVQPVVFLLPEAVGPGLRRKQLQKVEYVVRNTQPSDFVYDGDIRFNLYRRDLHYFWFSIASKKAVDTYNALTGGRYNDYDICALISSNRPKFVSDHDVDLADCRLTGWYDTTPFEGLYGLRPQDIQHPAWHSIGGLIAFLGYSQDAQPLEAARTLSLTLWWQAQSQMDRDYTAFIHLVGPDGQLLAQDDWLMNSNSGPTSHWKVGDTVEDRRELALPGDLPPGRYVLKIGVYYWETGERLSVSDEAGLRLPEDTIELSSISMPEAAPD
jgi:hypothetical protein